MLLEMVHIRVGMCKFSPREMRVTTIYTFVDKFCSQFYRDFVYSGFFQFHFLDCVLFSFDWTFIWPPWWKESFIRRSISRIFLSSLHLEIVDRFFSHVYTYEYLNIIQFIIKEKKIERIRFKVLLRRLIIHWFYLCIYVN